MWHAEAQRDWKRVVISEQCMFTRAHLIFFCSAAFRIDVEGQPAVPSERDFIPLQLLFFCGLSAVCCIQEQHEAPAEWETLFLSTRPLLAIMTRLLQCSI